jgi:hypothetical protein
LVAPLVAAAWTHRGALPEHSIAQLALPPHDTALPAPYATETIALLLHFVIAVGLDVSRIPIRPFAQLGWVSGTLGAPDVPTLFAQGGRRRNEGSFALVAGTLDTLLGRLVRQFIASSRRDGQDSFLPGLLVVFGLVAFVGGLFLGIAGAFLAALVVALLAHSLGAIEGTATVTAAVDAHADGFFYTRHQRSWG